jgi:hypothetical protein
MALNPFFDLTHDKYVSSEMIRLTRLVHDRSQTFARSESNLALSTNNSDGQRSICGVKLLPSINLRMRNVIHITNFRLWREQCGFTITQAGKAVSLTKQMASFLDRGWNGKYERCEPQTTRKPMMPLRWASISSPGRQRWPKKKSPVGHKPDGA